MRYPLTPIHCRPWLVNGLSMKLIESHYRHRGAGIFRGRRRGRGREVQVEAGPRRGQGARDCHSLDYIASNSPFLDRKGWDAVVTKMIKAFGAPIKPEDTAEIAEYLDKHYGKR